jgi:hypothetical protein
MEFTSGYHSDLDHREGLTSKHPIYAMKPLFDRSSGLNHPLLHATLPFSSDSSHLTVEGTFSFTWALLK